MTPSPRRGRGALLAAAVLSLSGLTLAGSPAFAADAFFPPVAEDDAYGMVQGTTLTVPAATGLLANDSYGDAGPLIVDGIWYAGATLVVHPEGGFSFTPDPSFSGTYTFSYTALDENMNLSSEQATVTITVTPKPNEAPVANPDVYSMVQGGILHIDEPGVLANDTDPEDDPLVVSAVQGHNSAEVVLNSAGWLTYTPDPSFTGTTTFQYRVDDGHQSSDWTTVTITVAPKAITEPPVANPDSYTTPKDTPLVISAPGVLVNDSIPTGTIADWLDTADEVVMTLDGGFTYTPPKGFVGTKTFAYNMSAQLGDDVSIQSNRTTVTITVTDTADGGGSGSTPEALAATGGGTTTALLVGGGSLAALGAAMIGIAIRRRRSCAL